MKIAITGTSSGLGKFIANLLKKDAEIYSMDLPLSSYIGNLEMHLKGCDIFINNKYEFELQTTIFKEASKLWMYKNKTIVNILTSAVFYGSNNKRYADDKKILHEYTISNRPDDKKVRIINIYPNALQRSKQTVYSTLNYNDVGEVISFAINLPQSIELFSIGINKTTTIENKGLI